MQRKSDRPLILILCGGRSLRLWPLSQYKSKNFLDIFKFSPLELTIKRFLKIVPAENIFLVTNQNEKRILTKIKFIKKSNIFFEPASKNTAAAILLSLLYLKKYSSKNIIISPIDHFIKKEREFFKVINIALRAASCGWLCALGIKPKLPTSSFGYIQVQGIPKKGIFKVKRFIEKPKPYLAKQLLRRGHCFYNSGMFISSIATLLDEYKKYYPDYGNFVHYLKSGKTSSLYRRIKDIPFDKAIMEKTKKAVLCRASFLWKDFGSWDTIYELLPKDRDGNIKRGKVFIKNSQNNLFYLDNACKKVLAMGLKDIFLIDTKDYVLLANRTHINNLKKALKQFPSLKS